MSAIGPQIPRHLLTAARNDEQPTIKQTSTRIVDDGDEYGPSLPLQAGSQLPTPAGPQLPSHLNPKNITPLHRDDYQDDEDAYVPALPPDLQPKSASSPKRTIGPSLSARPPPLPEPDSDNEVGPMPAPLHSHNVEDPVREFLEREERRRKAEEDAKKPKKLQREEWMLVPPSSGGILANLDPTKLKKPRHFSQSSAPARTQDTSLWTETPAERQTRLKDEVDGKRKRATDVVDAEDEGDDARKRRRYEDEVKRQIDAYNTQTRSSTLLDMHQTEKKQSEKDKDKVKEPEGIWDHARDMALGGRLMDDDKRSKIINEARGLGDRFGRGKSGFL